MADVMVAAGIDAAGDLDLAARRCSRATSRSREALEMSLRDRDRAGVGERAVIEARAGDDVGDEPDIRRGEADCVERREDARQVALRDMRQHQVLLVADADLAEAIALGEVGDCVHLVGRGSRRACLPTGFSESVTIA